MRISDWSSDVCSSDLSCALTAAALPEEQAYPLLYETLDGLLSAIEAAPAARGWAVALVRYELLILAELGFGLDFSRCAVTGEREKLGYVSTKSGAVVSAVDRESVVLDESDAGRVDVGVGRLI